MRMHARMQNMMHGQRVGTKLDRCTHRTRLHAVYSTMVRLFVFAFLSFLVFALHCAVPMPFAERVRAGVSACVCV